jgi:hypothetical protein
MRYCSLCGAENQENASFCISCGKPLTEAAAPPRLAKMPVKQSHTGRNLAVGILLIVIILLLGGAFYGQNGTPGPGIPKPDVVVTIHQTTMSRISLLEPAPGHIFLVLTLQIENHGSRTFEVNPYYFYVRVNNVEYGVDGSTFFLSDSLQPVSVGTGGSTSGAVAFEIPMNNLNYTPVYRGVGNPTIQWVRA